MILEGDARNRPAFAGQRIHPSWMLAAGFIYALCVVALDRLALLGAAAIPVVLLLVAVRPPRRVLARGLRGLATVWAVLTLVLLLSGGGEMRSPAGIPVSLTGWTLAARMGLKAVSVLTLFLTVSANAAPRELLCGLRSWGAPDALLHWIHLAHHYGQVLSAESSRTYRAMRARGFDFRPGWRTLRLLGYWVGSVMVRSLTRAEQVRLAMEARGYTGEFHGRSRRGASARDVIVFFMLTGYGVMLLAWQWRVGMPEPGP